MEVVRKTSGQLSCKAETNRSKNMLGYIQRVKISLHIASAWTIWYTSPRTTAPPCPQIVVIGSISRPHETPHCAGIPGRLAYLQNFSYPLSLFFFSFFSFSVISFLSLFFPTSFDGLWNHRRRLGARTDADAGPCNSRFHWPGTGWTSTCSSHQWSDFWISAP